MSTSLHSYPRLLEITNNVLANLNPNRDAIEIDVFFGEQWKASGNVAFITENKQDVIYAAIMNAVLETLQPKILHQIRDFKNNHCKTILPEVFINHMNESNFREALSFLVYRFNTENNTLRLDL
jgi:hypothetical protein